MELSNPLKENLDLNIKDKPFLIPIDLTPENIYSFNLPEKFTSNILIFLSLIRTITAFKATVMRIQDPFAQINSLILSEFILTLDGQTKEMINVLVSAGWIEVDNHFIPGKKSKGYRLGPALKNCKWIKKDWKETLETFVPAIKEKSRIARRKDVLYKMWEKANCFFTSWQTMPNGDLKDLCCQTEVIGLQVRVNYAPEIDSVIESAAHESMEFKRKKGELSPDWTLDKQIDNYNKALELFDGVNFTASCHDPIRFEKGTGRLFSNVVNLRSPLRKFLHIGGQSFVNVDIQSCQPALLSSFYLPEDSAEKAKFIDIICNSDIYNFVSCGAPRADAKDAMFHVMFGRNWKNKPCPIYQKFAAEFPILARRISDKKEEDGYRSVSYEMQKKEAEIMILGVLKELYFKDSITCLSIHDSILCFPEDAELVKNRIYSFFFAAMGFCPNIKIV